MKVARAVAVAVLVLVSGLGLVVATPEARAGAYDGPSPVTSAVASAQGLPVTLDLNTQVGDTLVVVVIANGCGGSVIPTISDSEGLNWTAVDPHGVSGDNDAMAWTATANARTTDAIAFANCPTNRFMSGGADVGPAVLLNGTAANLDYTGSHSSVTVTVSTPVPADTLLLEFGASFFNGYLTVFSNESYQSIWDNNTATSMLNWDQNVLGGYVTETVFSSVNLQFGILVVPFTNPPPPPSSGAIPPLSTDPPTTVLAVEGAAVVVLIVVAGYVAYAVWNNRRGGS